MTDNSTPDEGQGKRGRDGYNNSRRRRDGAPRGGRGPRRDDDRRGPRRDGGARQDGGERRSWNDRGSRGGTQGADGERRSWGDRREGQRPERRPAGGPRRDDDRRGPRDERGERRPWGERDERRGPRRDDERGERRPWGDRDDRRGPRRDDQRRGPRREGDRRGWGEREDRRSFREGDGRRFDRDEREEKVHRPGTAPRPDEPPTPEEFDEDQLHPGVKAELKGLPKDLADTVAAHIWAAGQLIDTDPDLAFRHAEAARRRAGRLPIVREAAAETAYAAGEYAVALREFRAIRRMSGGDELIPLIADCERALGRHRDALEILDELNPRNPDVTLHIECLLVEAGIRDDLGQRDEALRLLRTAVSRRVGPPQGQARLQYALANLLEETGDLAGAHRWFSSAAALDRFGDLDTADRLAALDGVTLPDDFSPDEDPDQDPAADDEATDATVEEPLEEETD